MVCNKCLEALGKKLVGQKTDKGYVAMSVKQHSSKHLFFNGYKPMFLLYFDAKKTANTGRVTEKEIDQLFVSKYCPSCGENLTEKKHPLYRLTNRKCVQFVSVHEDGREEWRVLNDNKKNYLFDREKGEWMFLDGRVVEGLKILREET